MRCGAGAQSTEMRKQRILWPARRTPLGLSSPWWCSTGPQGCAHRMVPQWPQYTRAHLEVAAPLCKQARKRVCLPGKVVHVQTRAGSSPIVSASKYVDILAVSSNAIVRATMPDGSPSTYAVLALRVARLHAAEALLLPAVDSGIFPSTVRSSQSTQPTVTANTAFAAGSSMQGKARRALVASNCVARMVWSSPAASCHCELYRPARMRWQRGDHKRLDV